MATTRSMAAAEAATNSGAPQPAANGNAASGVHQPAAATQAIEPLHLSELNQRSANLGCWEVGVSTHALRTSNGQIRILGNRSKALLTAAT